MHSATLFGATAVSRPVPPTGERPTRRHRRARLATVGLLPLFLVPLSAGSAAAEGSSYGEWEFGGGDTGSVSVPVAGFPSAQVTTDSVLSRVSGGTTTFLNDQTPFGAAYGSSRGHSYANLAAARGGAPSRTTLNFTTPTEPGSWALALGDIDADQVRITAIGADGNPLSGAELGFQDTFNYCEGSPRPSACRDSVDRPVWDEATQTLIGNSVDTNGASGWLRPRVPVTSLTLEFSVHTGIPSYQVWLAAHTYSVSGTVDEGNCDRAAGTRLALLDSDGAPVRDAAGEPVTTEARDDGSYAFPEVGPGRYRVAAEPPQPAVARPAQREADARTRDVAADFRLSCPAHHPSAPPVGQAPPPPASPEPPAGSPTPTSAPSASSAPATSASATSTPATSAPTTSRPPANPSPSSHSDQHLADTGPTEGPVMLGGAAFLAAAGGLAVLLARTRRRREER